MSKQSRPNPRFTYSRFSGDAITSLVLTKYSLPSAISCKFFVLGLHDNYLVETDNEKYILRVYRNDWRTKEEILFELELLSFLYQNNIPVAYPILSKTGKLLQAIKAPEGIRYAALFNYAPGKAVNERISEEQSYLLGETVSKLHAVTDKFNPTYQRQPLSLEYLLDDSLKLITPFLSNRDQDIEYLGKVKIEVISKVDGLSTNHPIFGICHGDIHSGNVHFTEDKQLTLFDFDQCGFGWRAFEIAKFLVAAHRMGLTYQIKNTFLDGYQTTRRLNKHEIEAIPSFMRAAIIWMMSIYIRNLNLVGYKSISEDFFNFRMSLLRNIESAKFPFKVG